MEPLFPEVQAGHREGRGKTQGRQFKFRPVHPLISGTQRNLNLGRCETESSQEWERVWVEATVPGGSSWGLGAFTVGRGSVQRGRESRGQLMSKSLAGLGASTPGVPLPPITPLRAPIGPQPLTRARAPALPALLSGLSQVHWPTRLSVNIQLIIYQVPGFMFVGGRTY